MEIWYLVRPLQEIHARTERRDLTHGCAPLGRIRIRGVGAYLREQCPLAQSRPLPGRSAAESLPGVASRSGLGTPYQLVWGPWVAFLGLSGGLDGPHTAEIWGPTSKIPLLQVKPAAIMVLAV